MVGGQILIVEIGGAAFSVTRLGGRDWGISLIIGLISLPIGACVRPLPSAPVERWLIKMRIHPDPNKLPVIAPEAEEGKYEYNPALTKVCQSSSF